MADSLSRLRRIVAGGPRRKLVIVRQRRQPGFRAVLVEHGRKAVWVSRGDSLFRRSLRIRVDSPQAPVRSVLDLEAVAIDALAFKPHPLLLGSILPKRLRRNGQKNGSKREDSADVIHGYSPFCGRCSFVSRETPGNPLRARSDPSNTCANGETRLDSEAMPFSFRGPGETRGRISVQVRSGRKSQQGW